MMIDKKYIIMAGILIISGISFAGYTSHWSNTFITYSDFSDCQIGCPSAAGKFWECRDNLNAPEDERWECWSDARTCTQGSIESISCPSSVNAGDSFTVSYEYLDVDTTTSAFDYEQTTLWRSDQGGTGNNFQKCSIKTTQTNDCTVRSHSFTATAPSDGNGNFIYRVRAYTTDYPSAASCTLGNWPGKSCTVNVVGAAAPPPETCDTDGDSATSCNNIASCSGLSPKQYDTTSCSCTGGLKACTTVQPVPPGAQCIDNLECQTQEPPTYGSTTKIKETLCDAPGGTSDGVGDFSYECYAPATCASDNNNCAENYCCNGVIGAGSSCSGKNVISGAYICDPGTWISCSVEKEGEILLSAGEHFECVAVGDNYTWKPVLQSKMNSETNLENNVFGVLRQNLISYLTTIWLVVA
jgi:hypothetical protein